MKGYERLWLIYSTFLLNKAANAMSRDSQSGHAAGRYFGHVFMYVAATFWKAATQGHVREGIEKGSFMSGSLRSTTSRSFKDESRCLYLDSGTCGYCAVQA